MDRAVTAVGLAAFLPQFAVFPVRYLDSDIAGAEPSHAAVDLWMHLCQ